MKRRSRTILKQLDGALDEARNGKKQEQEQIQRLKKVHLERDEFTEHKELEDVLVTLTVQARQLEDHYQGHRKRMIQTAALELEDRLNKIGKSDLVCHISEELIKVLKGTGINWSPIYLRRCLDERYKNPANRLNALARKNHPGVPQDTGKTAEELEASLNRKPIVGKYTVACEMELGNDTGILCLGPTNEKGEGELLNCDFLPVIVHVDALNQTATVELDRDAHFESIKESSKAEPEPEADSSSKPKKSTTKAKKSKSEKSTTDKGTQDVINLASKVLHL